MVKVLCYICGVACCAVGVLLVAAMARQLGGMRGGANELMLVTVVAPGIGLIATGVIFLAFGKIISVLTEIRDKR